MKIGTSRFGELDVDEGRLITFEKGILGFPNQTRYALIQTGRESGFYWLQAVERSELAFVVCDPRLFITDYQLSLKDDDLAQLELDTVDEAQIFVIVNKVDRTLTGNLQGPLVINVQTRLGRQLVLSDRRYTTRHPLMELPVKSEVVSKTA